MTKCKRKGFPWISIILWSGLIVLEILGFGVGLMGLARAESLLSPTPVPPGLPRLEAEKLKGWYSRLKNEQKRLLEEGKRFDSSCSRVEEGSPADRHCLREQDRIKGEAASYNENSKAEYTAVWKAVLCQGSLRVSSDLTAIRNLNAAGMAREAEGWEERTRAYKTELEHKAVDVFFSAALDRAERVLAANPHLTNRQVRNIRKLMEKSGINDPVVLALAENLAKDAHKGSSVRQARTLIRRILVLKKGYDMEDTLRHFEGLTGVLALIGIANPTVGMGVSSGEFLETLAMLYASGEGALRIETLTDRNLRVLKRLSNRLETDMKKLNAQKAKWRQEQPGKDFPAC
jgi:hypothetical protein